MAKPTDTHVPGSMGIRVQIVDFVQQMLDLHARVGKVKTDHERTVIERQFEAMNREIDRLVYELYGLSEEEIAIVEGATEKHE